MDAGARAERGDAETSAHVEGCDACAAAVASYRRLAARLGNLPEPEPSRHFVSSVMRAVAARSRRLGSLRGELIGRGPA